MTKAETGIFHVCTAGGASNKADIPETEAGEQVHTEEQDVGSAEAGESEEDKLLREELEQLAKEKERRRREIVDLIVWELDELLTDVRDFQVACKITHTRTHIASTQEHTSGAQP